MVPPLPPRIARTVRLAIRRRDRVAADTDEEIRFHLEMRIEALVARGLTREAAEAEAIRRFGPLDLVRPQLLAAARQREETLTMLERLEALRDDARYALRQLRRAPSFTAAVIVTFALGLGANATMFQIVDRLLLRPPAFLEEPDRTGRIYLRRPNPDGTERIDNNLSYLRYAELRDHARSFEVVAAFYQDERVIGTGVDARQGYVGLVSASFWGMFDVRPVIGRFFGPDEDRPPEGKPVAVLSHAFWTTRFGADRSVLGAQIHLGAGQYTIIGVAPPGFHGVWASTTVAYIPIAAGARDMLGSDRYYLEHNASWLEVMARRKPDVSVAATNADLTRVYRQSRLTAAASLRQTIPEQSLARTSGELAPILYERGPNATGSSRVALWLGGVSIIVLLIACANVANLLLARAVRRRREVAVRVALGVSRRRLVSQLLTESVLLAAMGGALGVALAHWGGGILRTLLLPAVDWSLVPAYDGRVLAFAAGAALLTGLLTGLAPVLHAMRSDVNRGLKAGQREGGAHRSGVRTGLLVTQAGLSVVLLVGAGLFVRSLRNVQTLDLGWDPERVLFVRADLRGVKLDADGRRELDRRMIERARTVPGVTHAASTFTVPFLRTWSTDVFVPGMDSASRLAAFAVSTVSDEYFATMGTRLLRGRAVGDADTRASPRVAVVSESMGRLLWKGRDPLGQCFRMGSDSAPCVEVVGVAEDITRGDLRGDDGLQLYIPAAQGGNMVGGLFVRAAGDARRVAEPVRRELQRLMPGMAFVEVRAMQSVLDPIVRQWKLGAAMFTIFGGLALALAAVGLYGVIAYMVAQRTHEMGVRVALGAQRGDIRRLVLAQGVGVAAAGAASGALVALVAVRYVEGLLFEVSPRDPLVFWVAALTIVVVAVLASLVPAGRATRVDPVVALRTE